MGRKKHVDSSGKITITDKRGNIVKTKEGGVTTKYKKGSRPPMKQMGMMGAMIGANPGMGRSKIYHGFGNVPIPTSAGMGRMRKR